jgi:DNA-binding HxlR family transcriptional regulator
MARGYAEHCPVARALDVVGERWTLLLVRDLLREGPRRFRDLLDTQPGLTPSVLSARLRLLEEHALVTRRAYSTHPPREEYLLTAKGRELYPVVIALRQWGARHYLEGGAFRHTDCDHDIVVRPHCPHCARPVGPDELRLRSDPAPDELRPRSGPTPPDGTGPRTRDPRS